MRVFTSQQRVTLTRDISAFLNLALGVGRGEPPEIGSTKAASAAEAGNGQTLSRLRNQVSQQRQQLERHKDQVSQQRQQLERHKDQISQQRQQLERRNDQIAVRDLRTKVLQEQLFQAREGAAENGSLERTERPAEDDGERPGIGLKPGDPHYRSWVGRPENYDLKAAIQVSLLLAVGLRETHKLVEVGCGSLRAGRMFIPYLLPGHYFGIEPNRWVLEEGIKHELGESILEIKRPTFRFVDDFSADGFGVEFDYALAQSIFSHTYPDMTLAGLKGISSALAPNGKIIANFVEREETTEDGSGWLYPGCTTHTWERMQGLFEESGLVARKIQWIQGMQWFVAARPGSEDEIDDLSNRLRSPLARPGAGNQKIGAENLSREELEL